MKFEDIFSRISEAYARYRPEYPRELFEYLATLVREHETAWDCATGNGQAAIGLVPFFRQVIATEASAEQIARAVQHPKITYLIVPAEKTGMESGSVDLLTVTQALHWLDLEAFYPEVKRILKPGGIIAASAYKIPVVSAPVDLILKRFHDDVVGPLWLPQNRRIHEGLSTFPFPFDEILPPEIAIRLNWDLHQLVGHLGTWSAAQRYREKLGRDPLDLIMGDLRAAWGKPDDKQVVTYPLDLRIGRTGSS